MAARYITQRELRNESGEIMRQVDAGVSFIVTRNGVPVAELRPILPRTFVPVDLLRESLRGVPPIDFKRFRRDVDSILDQDPTPRV